MADVVDDLLSGSSPSVQPPPPSSSSGDVVDDLLSGRSAPVDPRDPEADVPWHSMFTGAGRTEFPEAPEFRASEAAGGRGNPEFGRMLGSALLAADDKQIADVAVEALGATLSNDRFGNQMITHEGTTYYVNKPGASRRDLIEVLANVLAFWPAGKAGSAVKSLLGRAAVTGPASGVTSVLLDIGQEALGSKQGIDPLKAAITTVAGGAAEFVSPVAVKFWRFVRGSPKLFDEATGTLTGKGRTTAEAAGFDPDKMGAELSRLFADEAGAATGTKGAAQRIRGKEFGVPLTRGQAGGDFEALAAEEATRHGAYGQKAGDIMRGFDVEQQAAMRGARGDIQAQLGAGETRLARPQQAGEFVGPGLRGRAQTAREGVQAAYDDAAEGMTGRLDADGLRGLTRRLGQAVADYGLDPQLHPAAVTAIRGIAKLERSTRKRAKAGVRVTGLTLRRLETERRKLGRLIDSAANPADRSAATRMKATFDDWMDEAIDSTLFDGDEVALRMLKRARASRKEFGDMFEAGNRKDRAGKVIESILADERTPEQVMNYVMGRGKLGGLDVSVDVLKRIKKIAGTESEEWLALREAGWLKLAKEIGADGFSPTKFKNRLNDVLETNRSLMNELYTPDEVAMFGRFRDEVMRTVTPAAARNPSKTAYTLGRLAREWAGRMGTMLTFSGSPLGGAAFFTIKRVPEIMGTRRAKRAVAPLMPDRLRAPLFVSGVAGAARAEAPE